MSPGALRVKLFADGASLDEMITLAAHTWIRGFTTNPTLMRRAGVVDYRRFGADVLAAIPDRPVSFEVFSDEFDEMESQAHSIASWGSQVYVKIPITNTRGESSAALIRRLSGRGVKVNVTAVMTLPQVEVAFEALRGGAPGTISIFAGRIADTGRDPVPVVCQAVRIVASEPTIELIWASPREILNVWQADAAGCHIITMTGDVLAKLPLAGKDLEAFSLETVRMFRDDAVRAGYTLAAGVQRT